MDMAMKVKGIWPIRDYVQRRHSTTVEYVTGRPIYEMCTGVKRMEGYSMFLRWWNQEHSSIKANREVG